MRFTFADKIRCSLATLLTTFAVAQAPTLLRSTEVEENSKSRVDY